MLLLRGAAAGSERQHPDRESRPVRHRPGPARARASGCCPKYEVAIIDEAHTLESVAGEHLGLKLSSIGVDYTLSRLYNERTRRGLLSVHKVEKAIPLVQQGPQRPRTTSSTRSRTGITASAQGFNGRVRKPIGCPEILPEELQQAGHGDR